MELWNLANKNPFEHIKPTICHDVHIQEVEENEGDEHHSDQRAYLTIERSVYLYDSYLDDNQIERNIKWRLSCEINVWVDQIVCKETHNIISAQLDTELFKESFEDQRPRLLIDGDEIEDYELNEIELFQEFIFKKSDQDFIQSIINDIHIRKYNSKHEYVLTAIMKDNGEVFLDYYSLFSDVRLSSRDNYTEIFKSLALKSPYGPCMSLEGLVDPSTGKLKPNANMDAFSIADVDWSRGYSLIDVEINDLDDFEFPPEQILGLHIYEEV